MSDRDSSPVESVMLSAIDAGQAAQCYDEARMKQHPSVMAADSGLGKAPKRELVEILEDRFDGREQVEFAYSLVAEAYAAGRGAGNTESSAGPDRR